MPYAVVRYEQGKPKPKILRYRFNLRAEAEKMMNFFNQQVKGSLFQVIWVYPENSTDNRQEA